MKKIEKVMAVVIACLLALLVPFGEMEVNAATTQKYTITNADFSAAYNNYKNGSREKVKGISVDSITDNTTIIWSLESGEYTLGENVLGENWYTASSGSLVSLDANGPNDMYHSIKFSYDSATLNLNGKTLNSDVFVENDSFTLSGNGTVKGDVDICNGATATISGGTYEGDVKSDYSAKLTIKDGTFKKDVTCYNGATLNINGGTIEGQVFSGNDCELSISSGTIKDDVDAYESKSIKVSGGNLTGKNYGLGVFKCGSLAVSGGTFTGGFTGLLVADSALKLSGGKFICDGSGGGPQSVDAIDYPQSGIMIESNNSDSDKVFADALVSGYEYSPSIKCNIWNDNGNMDSLNSFDGDASYTHYTDQATISVVKKNTPDNGSQTPSKEDSSNKSDPKNYSNEWVDGKWYDKDGKQTYKYKGGWKVNSIGWWYEDENGWFPQNQWQKIDGEWYFFHDTGYMAENEYAGNWTAYSEGYWWVGSDGAWDGSEPGVWRLSKNGKWWFKDSTGWFAKSKWYRIGGKWYYFDDDGWWDESKKE